MVKVFQIVTRAKDGVVAILYADDIAEISPTMTVVGLPEEDALKSASIAFDASFNTKVLTTVGDWK